MAAPASSSAASASSSASRAAAPVPVPSGLFHLPCGALLAHVSQLIADPDELSEGRNELQPGAPPAGLASPDAAAIQFRKLRNYANTMDFEVVCLVDPNGLTQRALQYEDGVNQGWTYESDKSWFEGYSWFNMYCDRCVKAHPHRDQMEADAHVGWKFRSDPDAVAPDAPPGGLPLPTRQLTFFLALKFADDKGIAIRPL